MTIGRQLEVAIGRQPKTVTDWQPEVAIGRQSEVATDRQPEMAIGGQPEMANRQAVRDDNRWAARDGATCTGIFTSPHPPAYISKMYVAFLKLVLMFCIINPFIN